MYHDVRICAKQTLRIDPESAKNHSDKRNMGCNETNHGSPINLNKYQVCAIIDVPMINID